MARRGPKPRRPATIPLVQEWAAPAHLSDAARAEFDRIVELLRQRGTIDRTDVTLVVRRAEACEIAETAYRQLTTDGAFVESDRGNLSAHPAVKVHTQAVAEIVRIDSELELSPAAVKTAAAGATGGYSQFTRYLGGKSS